MTADPPVLPDNPSLEDWLAYHSRRQYLTSMNLAGMDEVARWVRADYRDTARGADRRRELENDAAADPA